MDLIDKTFQLDIDEKFLETCATGTLLGTIAKGHNFGVPKEVVLAFPQTSLQWRHRHGGPAQWIINEYVIPCLLDDVLKLREWGVDVKLTTMTRDPVT